MNCTAPSIIAQLTIGVGHSTTLFKLFANFERIQLLQDCQRIGVIQQAPAYCSDLAESQGGLSKHLMFRCAISSLDHPLACGKLWKPLQLRSQTAKHADQVAQAKAEAA
jgi:hypothetical protein